jgi:hypothetical protein
MSTQARYTHRVHDAALIAAARLDCLVRARALSLSRPAMCGIGLAAAAIAALAYLRGADLHTSLAGGQPGLLAVASNVTDDGRA